MTSSNCFKWCYLTVMISCVTSTRVLSTTRNSYCNKPWWKRLHTCDKWPELSYYKSGCSDTGFYNSVKQPATYSLKVNNLIHSGRMELLKVVVLVSTFAHFTMALSIEGKQNGTYNWLNIDVCLLQSHKHEWVAHARTQADYILWSFVLSPIYSLLLQCSCIFLLNTVWSIKMQEKLVCAMFDHHSKSSFIPGSPC